MRTSIEATKRPRCVKCNKALAPQHRPEFRQVQSPNAEGGLDLKTIEVRGALLGYGYAATGFFCTLTCGYWYAVDRLREAKA